MKIKLSRAQWESAGKRAGWVKTAKVIAEQTVEQIQEDVTKLENIASKLREIGVVIDQIRSQEIPMSEEGKNLMSLYSGISQSIRKLKQQLTIKTNAKSERSIKVAQNLETVKTPEKFTDREITRAIRDAIIAEEGAIKQYETVVDASDNSVIQTILQDIANEERVHVFELQELLNMLLPDEIEFKQKGEKEVSDGK
jgi:hypothetical protein